MRRIYAACGAFPRLLASTTLIKSDELSALSRARAARSPTRDRSCGKANGDDESLAAAFASLRTDRGVSLADRAKPAASTTIILSLRNFDAAKMPVPTALYFTGNIYWANLSHGALAILGGSTTGLSATGGPGRCRWFYLDGDCGHK
jgi:hypothetical protein